MWKKLASLIAGSILVSSCTTTAGKPIICEPGTALKNGRCQKIAPKTVPPALLAKKKGHQVDTSPRPIQPAPAPFLGRPSSEY